MSMYMYTKSIKHVVEITSAYPHLKQLFSFWQTNSRTIWETVMIFTCWISSMSPNLSSMTALKPRQFGSRSMDLVTNSDCTEIFRGVSAASKALQQSTSGVGSVSLRGPEWPPNLSRGSFSEPPIFSSELDLKQSILPQPHELEKIGTPMETVTPMDSVWPLCRRLAQPWCATTILTRRSSDLKGMFQPWLRNLEKNV